MEVALNISQLPREPQIASKHIVDVLLNKIYPLILKIRNNFLTDIKLEDDILLSNVQDVFTLCCSQIKKCLVHLFEVFKLEQQHGQLLQESRHCTLDRLSWCVNRLVLVEEKLEKSKQNEANESFEDTLFTTPMYFVNWLDHTFDILANLAEIIYKTDYKETNELYFEWKNEVFECVSVLHTSLDELLLSAMTLCKYCLPNDQIIVKTRCKVVLREAKVLFNELIEGDINGEFKATINSLRLPIMPTNINVLIDVLKDVLYALETNTNNALLALVVHCFSTEVSPVVSLKEHLKKDKDEGACNGHNGDTDEDCSYVKGFDMYNERLLQIGSFAVSCSSDKERIISLRSGLASLEALDPHLVPALMMSADGYHAELLAESWKNEVQDIRESVFLIVDPAAFAEKSKQMMYDYLLKLFNVDDYDNVAVCSVIDLGSVVQEFFAVYNNHEPDALSSRETLQPLLSDLDKVLLECKVVSDLLCKNTGFSYKVKKSSSNKEVTTVQLFKRLKLLYTLVNRINRVLHPEDNEDQFFTSEIPDDDEPPVQNATYTMNLKNENTYITSQKKVPSNMSRSVFARTTNVRTPVHIFPLRKLATQIKAQKCNEINFSVQLDELFNLSDSKKTESSEIVNEAISLRKNSILYNFSPRKTRSSLRKTVLNRCYNLTTNEDAENKDVKTNLFDKESVMDESISLQISEILDQMNDITKLLSTTKTCPNSNQTSSKQDCKNSRYNKVNTTISRYIRNIPENASSVELLLDDSAPSNVTNVTVPSDVSTLERMRDLNRVQGRIHDLKLLHKETRL